ncbi:hypothetical protein ACFL20_06405 [Spirochaetota bacterium]
MKTPGKTSIIIVFLFFILCNQAMARLFVDANLLYNHTWVETKSGGDSFENNSYGGLLDLGVHIMDGFSVTFGGFWMYGTLDKVPMGTPPPNSKLDANMQYGGDHLWN